MGTRWCGFTRRTAADEVQSYADRPMDDVTKGGESPTAILAASGVLARKTCQLRQGLLCYGSEDETAVKGRWFIYTSHGSMGEDGPTGGRLSSAPSSPTSAVGSSPPTNNEHYALESPSARFLKFKFPLQSEATILDFENADVKNLFSQITASTTTTEDEVPRSPIPHRDSAKSLFSEDLDDDDYHDSPYATRCIDKYDLALTAAKPMLKVN
ncbi:hypothetical protein TRICI_002095 [Trichomonascus ciferrii]|uniref:Uncharacterized protein n=1 Tax=Trichomonascus ciferrii TaxID=44093 RepID=A0A642V7T3_9ASCO|nr:hypothetical protein TRICI_002095 [Trichomonascus ciferrii]